VIKTSSMFCILRTGRSPLVSSSLSSSLPIRSNQVSSILALCNSTGGSLHSALGLIRNMIDNVGHSPYPLRGTNWWREKRERVEGLDELMATNRMYSS
jgi:hypothetical protein